MTKVKIFLSLTAVLIFFTLAAPSARADSDWSAFFGNPMPVVKKIISGLGFDNAVVKDMAKTLNVSNQKKATPTVTLTFEPSNPAMGEKITAVAETMNFMGDSSQLYHTWYLKHKNNNGVTSVYDATLNKTIACDGNGNCDWNDDGDFDIEDYKIEAMRIIANGGFDWEKAIATGAYSDLAYDGGGSLSGKYDAIFGGESQRGKDSGNAHCYYHDFSSGKNFELDKCIHLFPFAPDSCTEDDWSCTGDKDFDMSEKKFWHTNPKTPDTAGTGNSSDEANVAGLGAVKFTWNYQAGDKVGVVAEGAATDPTQYNDSSYKIMWALPKNKCDMDGYLDEYPPGEAVTSTTSATTDNLGNVTTVVTKTLQYTVLDDINFDATIVTTVTKTTTVTDINGAIVSGPTEVDSSGAAITAPLTADVNTGYYSDATYRVLPATTNTIHMLSVDPKDLNSCLESNLLNPGEGGKTKKLEVSLSYLPKTPINDPDPTGTNASLLDVAASTLGSKSNDIKYTWEVYKGNEVNPVSWGTPLLKSQIPEAEQTSGIGLSDFKFKLKFDPAPKYLRIKVTATEKISEGTTSEGIADVIIPITSTSDQINVYSTKVSDENDALTVALNKDKPQRCTEGMEQVICPVVKNELVGMEIPTSAAVNLSNFLWTIDGEPIKPIDTDRCSLNGDCVDGTGEATRVAYFPVLKNKGEQYSISLSADSSSSGKINLTKTFKVEDPSVTIVSEYQLSSDYPQNSCTATYFVCPEYLGSYVDLDGVKWPDYSKTSFVAVTGQTIKLSPELNMPFIQDAKWFVDGIEAVSLGATVETDGTLSFTADKLSGETYNISYGGIYAQDIPIKKILNSSFDVQLNEFYEKPIGASVKITMTDAFDDAIAQAPTARKILASIATDIPAYISFLFRVVLTTCLILFISWIFSALFPKTNED